MISFSTLLDIFGYLDRFFGQLAAIASAPTVDALQHLLGAGSLQWTGFTGRTFIYPAVGIPEWLADIIAAPINGWVELFSLQEMPFVFALLIFFVGAFFAIIFFKWIAGLFVRVSV